MFFSPLRWVVWLLLVLAAARGLGEGKNLALGRPYTLSPRPDYAHCTDPGDATQLAEPRLGEAVVSVPKFMDTLQLTRLLKAQLRRDLAAAREDIGSPETPAAAKAGLDKSADGLEQRIGAMPGPSPCPRT